LEKIRVLVADDHPVVRQGLAIMLAAPQDIELVAAAVDGSEAVEMVLDLHPDVAVLDMMMPGSDGIAATREIARQAPDTRVLLLASIADNAQVLEGVRAGASGFMLKDVDSDQLLEAIRAVHSGASVLNLELSRSLAERAGRQDPADDLPEPLTPRETDVLRLLARGMSNKEIARELTLTQHTVMSHVRNILSKLGLANRTQAALFARERKIA
jgi:NarL family two-component system response regulator LiaR